MNRKLLAMALAAAALAVGACGDDDEDTAGTGDETGTTTQPAAPETTPRRSGGGGGQTKLTADADPGGALKFTTEELQATPGRVTITMANPSELPHAVAIEGSGVDEEGETVEKGGTSTVTADLKPGEYKFYCPVPGHEEGGMVGTLTVK